MARWNSKLPGCSGHIHQSLWDEKKNLFYDGGDTHNMSPLFKSYLAGQLLLLPEVLAFYAPTVNSYKRLVEGFWAPTRANWGIDNRTVAHRVIPGSDKSCRLETRVGGADMNPYLSLSAALACGLYGIEKGLKLDEAPIKGNGYASKSGTKLSSHLHEAAERLASSDVAKELFGEAFVEHFASSRVWEWRQAQESVTDWELKRYFEIILGAVMISQFNFPTPIRFGAGAIQQLSDHLQGFKKPLLVTDRQIVKLPFFTSDL